MVVLFSKEPFAVAFGKKIKHRNFMGIQHHLYESLILNFSHKADLVAGVRNVTRKGSTKMPLHRKKTNAVASVTGTYEPSRATSPHRAGRTGQKHCPQDTHKSEDAGATTARHIHTYKRNTRDNIHTRQQDDKQTQKTHATSEDHLFVFEV